MFFRDELQGAGWSESHYTLNQETMAQAIVSGQVLSGVRVKLLGGGVALTHYRLSDPVNPRSGLIQPGPDPLPQIVGVGGAQFPVCYNKDWLIPGVKGEPAAVLLADEPFVAEMLRAYGGNNLQYAKNLYLRGIPAPLVTDGSDRITDARFQNALVLYRDELEQSWAFRAQSKDPNVAPLVTITNITNANPAVITAPGHKCQVGDTVRMSNVRDQLKQKRSNLVVSYNGLFKVLTVPDANTVTLLNYPMFVWGETGTLHRISYTYIQYARITQEGITHHKVGRPFQQQVGRSKIRR